MCEYDVAIVPLPSETTNRGRNRGCGYLFRKTNGTKLLRPVTGVVAGRSVSIRTGLRHDPLTFWSPMTR